LGSVVVFNGGEGNKATISGFTIQNGYGLNGGGIYCAYSSPTIIHDIVYNNSVEQYGGGIYCLFADPLIKNTLFHSNVATGDFGTGGGIYATYGSPVVLNCTSFGNTANTMGGSIYAYSSNIQIMNTISWSNNSLYRPEMFLVGGEVSVSYCDVEGGQTGVGNINADPMFCDISNGDFMLNSDSPCINSGLHGSLVGAFGIGCGSPVPVLFTDPYEITPENPGEPGTEEHFIIRLKNMGNTSLTIDDISWFETSGPVSGWLGLNNYPSSPLLEAYPDNYFDLDVIMNMNGIVDIPYVPAVLEGYLLIGWHGNETRVDISYEIDGGGFICDCIPGESNDISPINILDIVHMIHYKFKECPPGAGPGSCPPPRPYPVCSGDVNCDCTMDIIDIIYLIDYKFNECARGSMAGTCPPPCSCEDWVIECGYPIN